MHMYYQSKHGFFAGYGSPRNRRRAGRGRPGGAAEAHFPLWTILATSLASWALIICAVKEFILPHI